MKYRKRAGVRQGPPADPELPVADGRSGQPTSPLIQQRPGRPIMINAIRFASVCWQLAQRQDPLEALTR